VVEQPRISRRVLLAASAASALTGAGVGIGATLLGRTSSSPDLWMQPARAGAARVAGLHLQFGSDAAREIVVSWHSVTPVANPRVLLGTPADGFGRTVPARTITYRDAKSGTEVRVNHARLANLTPGSDYLYAAVHDGATPEVGTFRTAPSGRAAFSFTSFGDQATPTLGNSLGSPAAGDVTAGIERIAPLFNLVNGDLCYANLAPDRVRTWSDWFENNTRSARYRPWMPAAGNHENEIGNGPIGYGAYQTYFAVPDVGAAPEMRGLWYSFTVGSVRVVSLNNDDICLQDGGNTYVHGYSGDAQKRWLANELAEARGNPAIDWIVVCMHQTAVSTADRANGADLGIRRDWLPLFDTHGVDLVVCGHEHHYERSHPIRGAQPTDTLTPIPVSDSGDELDTSKGTVHLVIGSGGTSAPSNTFLFDQPRCRVITGVGGFDPALGRRRPIYLIEDAPWSAFRDRVHPYGFVAFDVDPGRAGGQTRITATQYAVAGPYGDLTAVDRFTLVRPRG
jgi:3',5'-cyclic AMP phosphodiesterase CpdA